jgi:hypothetical protein
MPLSRLWASDESGSASLEFVTAGLLLLVPLVYLVLALAQVQAGAFATEAAARQAARVFVQGRTMGESVGEAQQAVRFALADYGLRPDAVDIRVTCTPDATDCLRRHGSVTITIRTAVALPLAPPVLNLGSPLAIPLEARSTEQVSRFRSDG